ncbi:hypothetical protein ABBQ32_004104 [Trebouxia sp. C0010 RCD-2024]
MQQLTSLRLFPLLLRQRQCCLLQNVSAQAQHSFSSTVPVTDSTRQQDASNTGGSSWMPSWLKSRLPESLGGSTGGSAGSPAEEIDLDKYASTLRQARKVGSIANMIPGVSRANTADSLRLYEDIINAMQPQEKQQLASFGADARHRVAEQVKCNVSAVDDCIAKFLYMKSMTGKVKQLKAEGKPMPKDFRELEQQFGSWQSFKTTTPEASVRPGAATAGSAGGAVPSDAKSPQGYPCPWAGQRIGRSTKCPATNKSYKACCGKRYGLS